MAVVAREYTEEGALAESKACDSAARGVIETAFGLLASLRALGPVRVSELQRHSGLPRTTVHRLLRQLEEVGAAERSRERWRLGPTLITFGAGVAAEPRLRAVARRPLMDLANASGARVELCVETAGHGVVVDVMPGTRSLAHEQEPGFVYDNNDLAAVGLEASRLAVVRAHERARHGDLRPVLDSGGADPRMSCVSAPLRTSARDVVSVNLMVPGRAGIPASLVDATGRTAGRIAAQLSRPAPS
jgi:IclR family transcriptional regulator, acetate operon repressor